MPPDVWVVVRFRVSDHNAQAFKEELKEVLEDFGPEDGEIDGEIEIEPIV